MRIAFKKTFEKKFKKLPEKIKLQFYNRLETFISNPFDSLLNNHLIEKAYPNCRSINITGDYRALFFETNCNVVFILIGTHSELYS